MLAAAAVASWNLDAELGELSCGENGTCVQLKGLELLGMRHYLRLPGRPSRSGRRDVEGWSWRRSRREQAGTDLREDELPGSVLEFGWHSGESRTSAFPVTQTNPL